MPRDNAPFLSPQPQKKKILFLCGSINQTTQMHQIAKELPEYDAYFTPYYVDGGLEILRKLGMLEFTVVGGTFFKRTSDYLLKHQLNMDYRAQLHTYDLVVRCADLIVPKNTRHLKSILVQEGMTDPRNIRYYIIKHLGLLPRWVASTATFGMSDAYDKMCVASSGYRDHFIESGVKPEKIEVTGIPNFDNCQKYRNNTFPHHGFALVCTSDMRETLRYENRPKFINRCLEIANGRLLIFKLHPNENVERASLEINHYAPGALIYSSGSAEEMIANCDVLITRYSSVVLVASALGKEVYSDLDSSKLSRLTPLQNQSAAKNIASVCLMILEGETVLNPYNKLRKKTRTVVYLKDLATSFKRERMIKKIGAKI